jgi:PAS domain S-box-containing protein
MTLRDGSLQAVLSVYALEPREWLTEEIAALEGLAAQAASAHASAELYERVALERERSLAILANVADGIVAAYRDGNVVLWNAAAERITGVPASEAIGRTPEQVLQRSLHGAQGGEGGNRVVSIRRGSEEVWLSLTEAVMRDPAGNDAGRIFAFRDISTELAVEQMKSGFVSTVSHELRAPLTSIYGFAATLLRDDVRFGEAERRTFLTYIASEAERLTSIVDQLLNVARLDAGDLEVHLAPTDVREVVAEVVESAKQAEQNGHRFVVELPDRPLETQTDAEKLGQVLSNLVENAVRFSPGGGTVTVGAYARDDAVEVRVADEGVGIPEAERERIFSKFYRADPASELISAGTGTGVGLFIVRGLVNALGGRISVSSAEGVGSCFVVELPRSQDERPLPEPVQVEE